jgi:hypothetical protein
MRNLIDRTTHRVFRDFRTTASRVGSLCACKDLTYKAGNVPDYSNPMVQQNYMLRYFPAYLVEYYAMYSKMLALHFLPPRLNVLSIGCGSGVDLWGLYFAIESTGGNPTEQIRYTGIDLIDWQYRDCINIPNVRFLQQNITAWQQLDASDYNVIVFPKSIGEFPVDVFADICAMFRASRFDCDRICFLCSLMDKGISGDSQRYQQIASIIEATHNYRSMDNANTHWHIPESHGLRWLCTDFVYPDDVKDGVDKLLNSCPTFVRNKTACKNDCTRLNRSPILNTSYIKYAVGRFER